MASYLVLWHANSASWPTDPKQVLQALEAATAGGDMLLKSGGAKALGWLSAESGYAIFEADSKAAAIGMVQPFFPMFSQEVLEIVPWDAGKDAILTSARAMASR
jgi:hypothetical protein